MFVYLIIWLIHEKFYTTYVCTLPSFSRLIHLTIQEDGIKRQSWLFVGKLPQETFFSSLKKLFQEYRAAKAAVVLLLHTTTTTGNWLQIQMALVCVPHDNGVVYMHLFQLMSTKMDGEYNS